MQFIAQHRGVIIHIQPLWKGLYLCRGKMADVQDKGTLSLLSLYKVIDFVKGHLGVV